MFIKLQQKTTKKISQFTIANSQQSTIIIKNRIIKRLIEYLVIERRIEYIQYESSSKSSNARNYTSYSTLKAIRLKFRHFHLFLCFNNDIQYSTIFKFIIIIDDI